MDVLSYNAMRSDGVYLVIPGLLAPEAMSSAPVDAAPIGRFLSWSEQIKGSYSDLESLIAGWFNPEFALRRVGDITGQGSAAAKLGYQSEIASTEAPTEVFRVDPVYQQMDINHATLADQSLLNLDSDEATALLQTLNDQFADDGLRFESDHPLRWYCCFDRAMAINTVSLSAATGRDVSLCRPTGEDSRHWRSLLAEIEMILFSHPINQQREARGELPVNSVWLWGEGQLPEKRDHSGNVYTGNFYTLTAAEHYGLAARPVADFSLDGRPTLLVDDRLAVAAATGDAELRAQVVGELSRCVFSVLDRSPGLNKRGLMKRGVPVALWTGGDTFWHLPERISFGQWLKHNWRPQSYESFIDVHSLGVERGVESSVASTDQSVVKNVDDSVADPSAVGEQRR